MRSVIDKHGGHTASWADSNGQVMELFKKAEADNAALVEMLAEIYCTMNPTNLSSSTVEGDESEKNNEGLAHNSILGLLAQPHPGWAMVDKLSRLKQVAEAARPFLRIDAQQDVRSFREQLLTLARAFSDLDRLSEENTHAL